MLKTKRDCDRFTVPDGKNSAKTLVFNHGLPGLTLVARRTKTGAVSKSWRFILRKADVTLGTYAAYQDLDKVREWHRQQYERHQRGQKPEKVLSDTPLSMDALFHEWLVVKCPEPSRPGRKSIWNKHARSLHGINPAHLTYQDVFRLLLSMGISNAAHRVTQTVKSMMHFGFQKYGFGGTEPIYLPAKLSDVHDRREVNAVIARQRDVTLSKDEFKALWHKLGSSPAHAALRLLMFSGCRKSEAAGICWDEIDDGVWLLPANRSKTRTEICRPLPDFFMANLAEWEWTKNQAYVFGRIGSSTINHALERLIQKRATVHDLRRSFANLAGTEVGIAPHIVDQMLGHTLPSRMITTYQPDAYHSEVSAAWEAWYTWFKREIKDSAPPAE